MLDLIISVASAVILLILGFGFGRYIEKRHYANLIQREQSTLHFPLVNMRTPPASWQIDNAFLVHGSVVISVDYFKRFLAALRNFFGGRIGAYETLLDRARREAILRMKEQAMAGKSNMIYNIRLETASISKYSNQSQSIGSIEVLAYGTAINVVSQ